MTSDQQRVLTGVDDAIALLNQVFKLQGATVGGQRVFFSFQFPVEPRPDVQIAR